jgi:hypothetical protein
VASAMVNTMQQVGGSIGTALLSTFAAHATKSYLIADDHGPDTATLVDRAATHGYTVAFAISAGIFLLAALICGSLIRKHPLQPAAETVDELTDSSPVVANQ